MKDSIWQKALRVFGFEEEFEEEEHAEEPEFEDPPRVKPLRTRDMGERRLKTVEGSGPMVKVHLVEPLSFNDAQEIADRFRQGIPVIVNLSRADRDVGRRVIDFSSGVVYALRGAITPIAPSIYLLTPRNVEITPADRERLRESFFNQY